MDSRTINKLIRSEIWPLLRAKGFSRFESRTAFRYAGPFIHVVNFQSFNSYLAASVGCSTYSFALNLGVYVLGSARNGVVKKDLDGAFLPREWECAFRFHMQKRTSVDGFNRSDIFYIDPSGASTAACFDEVRFLLTEVAPEWFQKYSDLNVSVSGDEAHRQDSYVSNDLQATLLLLKLSRSPSVDTARSAVQCIHGMVRNALDWESMFDTPSRREEVALRVRELWDRLGPFASNPEWNISNTGCDLFSQIWDARSLRDDAKDKEHPAHSVENMIWPVLRDLGFTEFSSCVAHQISGEFVETIQITPLDRRKQKEWKSPVGLFYVAVGIYWLNLREQGLVRFNRAGDPRPRATECHLNQWMIPKEPQFVSTRSLFCSFDELRQSLTGSAMQWFHVFRSAESALTMLQQTDWETFCRFPMMRGQGCQSSARRFLYLANLASLLERREQVSQYIDYAETAVNQALSDKLRPRYKKWMQDIKARVTSQGRSF